jgi:hypothetical protein
MDGQIRHYRYPHLANKPKIQYHIFKGDFYVHMSLRYWGKQKSVYAGFFICPNIRFFYIPSTYTVLVWIYIQSVRLLGRVISPSQGLYLNTGQHKYRKTHTHTHTHINHPCPKWDSNTRSQRPRERRQFMP